MTQKFFYMPSVAGTTIDTDMNTASNLVPWKPKGRIAVLPEDAPFGFPLETAWDLERRCFWQPVPEDAVLSAYGGMRMATVVGRDELSQAAASTPFWHWGRAEEFIELLVRSGIELLKPGITARRWAEQMVGLRMNHVPELGIYVNPDGAVHAWTIGALEAVDGMAHRIALTASGAERDTALQLKAAASATMSLGEIT